MCASPPPSGAAMRKTSVAGPSLAPQSMPSAQRPKTSEGSVIAALFLKRFVHEAKRFAHLDIFGWVPRERPGRPKGGEPQAARALFEYFRKELGTS